MIRACLFTGGASRDVYSDGVLDGDIVPFAVRLTGEGIGAGGGGDVAYPYDPELVAPTLRFAPVRTVCIKAAGGAASRSSRDNR